MTCSSPISHSQHPLRTPIPHAKSADAHTLGDAAGIFPAHASEPSMIWQPILRDLFNCSVPPSHSRISQGGEWIMHCVTYDSIGACPSAFSGFVASTNVCRALLTGTRQARSTISDRYLPPKTSQQILLSSTELLSDRSKSPSGYLSFIKPAR